MEDTKCQILDLYTLELVLDIQKISVRFRHSEPYQLSPVTNA